MRELGLTARGDVIALKAFCFKHSQQSGSEPERKKILLDMVKNNGRLQTGGKIGKKQRAVLLGWLHYDKKKAKYCSVRANKGGGSREIKLDDECSKKHLIKIATSLFFPNGKSSFGDLDNMLLDVGNFKEESLDATMIENDVVVPFTVGKYIQQNKLSRTRLYLMSKKEDLFRSVLESTDTDEIISSDDDDILQIPALKTATPFNQSTCHSIQSMYPHTIQAPVAQEFAMYPTQVMLPNFPYEDNLTNNSLIGTTEERSLIGTTEERLLLRNEIDLALMESLEFDRNRPTAEPSVETSTNPSHQDSLTPEFLQEKRKARVPPEPPLQEARTLVFARHTTMGTVSRFFKDSDKLMAVYDWVGSLSPLPCYFSLCLLPGIPLQPIDSVKKIDRMVQMQELTEPLFLDLEDQEVSFAGYGLQEEAATINLDEKTIFQQIQQRREEALSVLKEDPFKTAHVVKRANVIKDLVKLYNDVPELKETVPLLKFAEEDAVGDGVSRDV